MSGEEDAIVGWNTPFGVGGGQHLAGKDALVKGVRGACGEKEAQVGARLSGDALPFRKKENGRVGEAGQICRRGHHLLPQGRSRPDGRAIAFAGHRTFVGGWKSVCGGDNFRLGVRLLCWAALFWRQKTDLTGKNQALVGEKESIRQVKRRTCEKDKQSGDGMKSGYFSDGKHALVGV